MQLCTVAAFSIHNNKPNEHTHIKALYFTMAYYREHEHQQAQQSQQHSSWFYAAAFATIALVALLQDVNRFSGLDDLRDQDQQIKWAASGIICALGLACIGFLLGLFLRHRFVGNILELILVRMRV